MPHAYVDGSYNVSTKRFGYGIVLFTDAFNADGTPQEIFSNVEEMERISLDVPMAAKIAKKLKDEGFEFSRTPVKIEELAEKLCQFRS